MQLTLNETFLAVLVSLVGLSVLFTGLGTYLHKRTVDPLKQQRLELVSSRLRASWSIVAVFSVAFALGTGALLFVFAVASFFALRNFVSLTPIRPADHWALVLAFYVVTPLHYILIGVGQIGLFTVFIPVYVFLLLPVVMALKQDNERYLERVAKVQWGLMICVYCISHAPAILELSGPEFGQRGPLLLVFFLLILYVADLAQVIASATLGGTPLKSDPTRTWAGVMVAAAVSGLLGTALWWMTPFRWWQSTLMSLIVALAGFLGTVVLTSVKKSLGARDWDTGIVGVRAVLDRLDALAFAAPVFFHLTAWLYSR
ncbi:MAG: phosphatidate cytidylyltransferase [Burkholderiaceae bacterium]